MNEDELEQFDYHNEQYHLILEGAYLMDQIDEWSYHMLRRIDIENMNDQEEAYNTMIGCIEKNNLMDRIIKGAELIELEKDPAIKRRYIDVYESLIHELERLKSA